MLASFAALLITLCRAEDLPARLGGDEFSVLLPGIKLAGAWGSPSVWWPPCAAARPWLNAA